QTRQLHEAEVSSGRHLADHTPGLGEIAADNVGEPVHGAGQAELLGEHFTRVVGIGLQVRTEAQAVGRAGYVRVETDTTGDRDRIPARLHIPGIAGAAVADKALVEILRAIAGVDVIDPGSDGAQLHVVRNVPLEVKGRNVQFALRRR